MKNICQWLLHSCLLEEVFLCLSWFLGRKKPFSIYTFLLGMGKRHRLYLKEFTCRICCSWGKKLKGCKPWNFKSSDLQNLKYLGTCSQQQLLHQKSWSQGNQRPLASVCQASCSSLSWNPQVGGIYVNNLVFFRLLLLQISLFLVPTTYSESLAFSGGGNDWIHASVMMM